MSEFIPPPCAEYQDTEEDRTKLQVGEEIGGGGGGGGNRILDCFME